MTESMSDQVDQVIVNAITAQQFAKQIHGMQATLDAILKAVGDEGEDEYGKRVGTGLTGRMMRLEVKVDGKLAFFDSWSNRIVGAAAAITAAIGIVWWSLGDRITMLLKPTP